MEALLKDILACNQYMATRAAELDIDIERMFKELYVPNDPNNRKRFIAEVWEEIDLAR